MRKCTKNKTAFKRLSYEVSKYNTHFNSFWNFVLDHVIDESEYQPIDDKTDEFSVSGEPKKIYSLMYVNGPTT